MPFFEDSNIIESEAEKTIIMLKQLWATGILVAFSVFGIKVGLGLGAQLFNRSISFNRKLLFISGCLLIYLILFFSLYYVVTGFDLLIFLDHIIHMIR